MSITEMLSGMIRSTLSSLLAVTAPPPTARQLLDAKIRDAHDWHFQYLQKEAEAAASALYKADAAVDCKPSSTTNFGENMKRKRPSKPNAEQRKLAADWEALMKRHSQPLELGAKAKGVLVSRSSTTTPTCIRVSDAPKAAAEVVDVGRWQRKMCGHTAPVESPIYTGSACKGVATMHKSNSVPVFSAEEAVDVAKMRRN